ncbi:MAG TPA: hypothetical protein VEZ89_09535, partial [Rubrivivax sp.]|nr:hypothetical protein [Rubrivivax sp.]
MFKPLYNNVQYLCAASLLVVAGAVGAAPPADPPKMATEMRNAIAASTMPQANWVKETNGRRYVKALVVARTSDPEMTSLRADVLARGGSVFMRFVSVTALSVMLPADQVGFIAARSDVQSISPNRMTARTATQMTPSHIEAASGVALSVRQRTETNGLFYNGLDGRGVGIAVLDSGVMSRHQLFNDSTGQSRVKRAVNFLKVGDSIPGGRSWQPGVDVSTNTAPGTEGRAAFERTVDNANGYSDGFGH